MSFELSTVEPVKENFAPVKTGRVFTATGGLSARAGPAAADWEKRIASSADPLAVWKECVCAAARPALPCTASQARPPTFLLLTFFSARTHLHTCPKCSKKFNLEPQEVIKK